jgi:hypothetical protein
MFSLKTKVFQLSNVIRVLYYHDFDADLKNHLKKFLETAVTTSVSYESHSILSTEDIVIFGRD